MNWAEAIVIIVIIGMIGRTLRTAILMRGQGERHIEFDHKGNPKGMRRLDPAPHLETEALRQEVTDLRERIKVLERIATEDRKARDLAAEIEDLRQR